MIHPIRIKMRGYLDENDIIMDRPELNKRIVLKDKRIEELELALDYVKEHFLTETMCVEFVEKFNLEV